MKYILFMCFCWIVE